MARFDSSDRLDAGLRFDQPAAPTPPSQSKTTKMNPFNLDLKNKNVTDKIDLGKKHIAAMTNNANYPTEKRVPTDAEVAAAQSALETTNSDAEAAETAWKEK